MQYFGQIETKYEEVFLTSSYMYFNRDDETITAKDLKQLIKTHKDRKKNIAGTVFIYNPVVTPIGFDSNNFLLDQDFDQFGEMIELKTETYITVFKNAMSKEYQGKVVEIKSLFNLIEKHIDASTLLMKFDSDLEMNFSNQKTEFDRELMYLDYQTIIPNGKFVFFCWGDKISTKEFPYIRDYAKGIYDKCISLNKKIAFVYKRERSKEGTIEYLQFGNPMSNIKLKNTISNAIKESFKSNPPIPTSYE